MAIVESTFVLRSTATAELEAMQVKANELEGSFTRLGTTMDASMAKGGAAAKGATARQSEHVAAADASAAAAARSASAHERAASRTSKAWSDSGSSMVKTGKVILGTLLAVGVASVSLATKYESMVTQFHTQAGSTQREAQEAGKAMLKMGAEVGTTPQKLAESFYHVASSMNALLPAGHRVGIELAVTREAAKLAAIGHSNLAETTYVLSSAMNALGRRTIPEAKTTMAELNAIVGSGDMHMQDLVGAMSTGLPEAARTFHVSLQSVGAALAYMTDRGVPAQQAATRLRMSLSLMGAPTKQAAGILHDLGLSHTEVTTRTKAMDEALEKSGVRLTDLSSDLRKPNGIYVALMDLKTHMTEAGVSAETQSAIISRAFGGGRSGGTIMALYNELGAVKAKYNEQTRLTGEIDKDWATVQKTLSFQLDATKGAIEGVGIKIGDVLIPWVEKGLEGLGKLATFFEHNKTAATALAVVLGTVMVASVTALAVNVTKKLASATMDFVRFGKSVAMLPQTIGGKIGSVIGGPGTAETGAVDQVVSRDTASATWGLRSMTGPFSEMNPGVVVISGGGMGGIGAGAAAEGETGALTAESAAAKGYTMSPGGLLIPKGAAGAVEGATVAETAAGAGGASLLARLRGGAGALLGAGTSAALSGGMGFLGAQLVGGLVGGKTGQDITSSAAGAGVGAAVGSMIAPGLGTWVGAIAGGALQTALHKLGAHGSAGDIGAGAVGGALATAPLAAVSGPAAPVVAGVGALLGGAMGAFTGQIAAPGGALAKADMARSEAALKAGKGGEAIETARRLRETPGETELSGSKLTEFKAHINDYIKGVETAVATNAGQKAASEWAKGWQSALARGESPTSATAQLTAGIKMELDKLGPVGRMSLATSLTKWTQQVAKAEPEMAAPMKELEQDVANSMTRMGQKVTIVNGQILSGSVTQWNSIATAITSPTQVALEKLSGTFGQMKQEAIGALTQMGYSPGVAQGILKDLGSGAAGQQVAGEAVKAAQGGHPLMMLAPHGATGMRVPGGHGPDSVGVFSHGGGLRGIVAPGELLVANRHTEARVNNMLGAFGTTLGQEVAGETVPHYATGGAMTSTLPGSSHYERLIAAANKVSAANFPYKWGGGHEQPAHYEPFDCSGSVSYITQQAGYNVPTSTSGNIPQWHFPGGGGTATIFYNPTHTFMRIGGRYWGTSGFARPGGGAGWFDQAPGASYLAGFNTVHLPNLGAAGNLGEGLLGGGIAQPGWTGPSGILGAIGVSLGHGVVGAMNASLSRLSGPAGAGGSAGGGQALADLLGGPGGGNAVGASYYGGPRDPSSGVTGYRGDNLMQHPDSYAELNMGHALGGLPYMTPLRVTGPNGKSMTLYKRDIGAGGGPVEGHPRAIDLWYEAAEPLGVAQRGLATVDVQKMSKGGYLPEWGGWHSAGGAFTVRRPTYIGVGDGGEEHVRITPKGRGGGAPATATAGPVQLSVNIEKIDNHQPGDIANVVHAEIERLATMIEQEHNSVPHESERELLV